jgi:hypothetical protein
VKSGAPSRPPPPVEVLVPFEEDRDDTDRYILDIKTTTARAGVTVHQNPQTGEIAKTEVKPSAFEKLAKPKDEHIAQTSLYAWMTTQPDFKTGRIAGPLPKLPKIMLIYVAKDLDPKWFEKFPGDYPERQGLLNSPFKVFTVEPKLELIEVLLKKVDGIHTAIARGRPPPRGYHH